MPRIPTSQPSIVTGRLTPRLQSLSEAGAVGESIAALGRGIQGQLLQEEAKQQKLLDDKARSDGAVKAAETMARIQQEQATLFAQESTAAQIKDINGTTTLQGKTDSFQNIMSSGLEDIISNNTRDITNPYAQEILNKNLPAVRKNAFVKSLNHESSTLLTYRKEVFNETSESLQQAVYDDPEFFIDNGNLLTDTVNTMGLPADQVQDLGNAQRNKLALSAGLGMVNQNPLAAEEMLDDPKHPIRKELTIAQIEKLKGMVRAGKSTSDASTKKLYNQRKEDYYESLKNGGARNKDFENAYNAIFLDDPAELEDFAVKTGVFGQTSQTMVQMPTMNNQELIAITQAEEIQDFIPGTKEASAAIVVLRQEAERQLKERELDPVDYLDRHFSPILSDQAGQDKAEALELLQRRWGVQGNDIRLLSNQQLADHRQAIVDAQVNPTVFRDTLQDITQYEPATSIALAREVLNGSEGLDPVYEALVLPIINNSQVASTLMTAISNRTELNKQFVSSDVFVEHTVSQFSTYQNAMLYGSPERARAMSQQETAFKLLTKHFMSQGMEVDVASDKARRLYIDETYYPIDNFPMVVPKVINNTPVKYDEVISTANRVKALITDGTIPVDMTATFGTLSEAMLTQEGELTSEGEIMLETLVPKLTEDGSQFYFLQSTSPFFLPLVSVNDQGMTEVVIFDTLQAMEEERARIQKKKESRTFGSPGFTLPRPSELKED